MIDLAIFTKAPSAYEPGRIYEEAQKRGLKAEIISYSDLDFSITDRKVEVLWKGSPLPNSKMVVVRAAGGEIFYIPQRDFIIDWFGSSDAKVLNSATYKKWSRLDKITQHFEFVKAHLPVIESKIYGLNERLIERTRHFPLIIKKNLSSRGKDVYKVNNLSDIKELFDNGYYSRIMLLQPFLKVGEDLRIIVLGGNILGAMRRIAAPGKYLTNYSQGGMIESYDVFSDREAMDIAKKTSAHFLLDYVGIDLMKDENGAWRVLEVNRACQFQGFEKATGINIPSYILNFLEKK